MRSTWRTETMVLPELSQTMGYTTRKIAQNSQLISTQTAEIRIMRCQNGQRRNKPIH